MNGAIDVTSSARKSKYSDKILELTFADHISDYRKNSDFGFSCLHYSASHSVGKVPVEIINKNRTTSSVWVVSQNGDAHQGNHYGKFKDLV